MAQEDEQGRRKAMAAVQDIFDRYKLLVAKTPGREYFDQRIMSDLTLLDAQPTGTSLYSLVLSPHYSNLNNVMHGGAAGLIFDMCTTTALGPLCAGRTDHYFFLGGVTRSLNVSYLRAVPVGARVRVRSWVVGCGRTMAFIRGEMTSEDGKVVYCAAEHHKVNMPALQEHLNVETDLDRKTGRTVGSNRESKSEGSSKL